jgi:hypothetical protein
MWLHLPNFSKAQTWIFCLGFFHALTNNSIHNSSIVGRSPLSHNATMTSRKSNKPRSLSHNATLHMFILISINFA